MADLPSDSVNAEALSAAGSAHHEYEQTALERREPSCGQPSTPPSSSAGSAVSVATDAASLMICNSGSASGLKNRTVIGAVDHAADANYSDRLVHGGMGGQRA